ncbi:MAG: DUF1491 family protein [Alphaproteobacteria bacterium]|nr:DUF1491 family protein [Alphaproteobacteria bacterium]
MSEIRPATELFVKAQIRTAGREGVPVTIVHRGDPTSGTVILKINLLNGTARVLVEARAESGRIWMPATATDPMTDAAAESYLSRQASIDPDVWIVEIEDKKGRLWFPGRVAGDEPPPAPF